MKKSNTRTQATTKDYNAADTLVIDRQALRIKATETLEQLKKEKETRRLELTMLAHTHANVEIFSSTLWAALDSELVVRNLISTGKIEAAGNRKGQAITIGQFFLDMIPLVGSAVSLLAGEVANEILGKSRDRKNNRVCEEAAPSSTAAKIFTEWFTIHLTRQIAGYLVAPSLTQEQLEKAAETTAKICIGALKDGKKIITNQTFDSHADYISEFARTIIRPEVIAECFSRIRPKRVVVIPSQASLPALLEEHPSEVSIEHAYPPLQQPKTEEHSLALDDSELGIEEHYQPQQLPEPKASTKQPRKAGFITSLTTAPEQLSPYPSQQAPLNLLQQNQPSYPKGGLLSSLHTAPEQLSPYPSQQAPLNLPQDNQPSYPKGGLLSSLRTAPKQPSPSPYQVASLPVIQAPQTLPNQYSQSYTPSPTPTPNYQQTYYPQEPSTHPQAYAAYPPQPQASFQAAYQAYPANPQQFPMSYPYQQPPQQLALYPQQQWPYTSQTAYPPQQNGYGQQYLQSQQNPQGPQRFPN